MRNNLVKEKLKKGECAFGVFANGISPEMMEIMALAGFDFICIDSEHASSDPQTNRLLLMAAEARGADVFIRVPNKISSSILQNLDVGAKGLLVPQVNSRKEAEQVVYDGKYFPEGMRGVATPRASDYGMSMPIKDYMKWANENLLITVQCENVKCLDELDEIAAVDGVDVIFIGPFDLSQSMGIPGQVYDEKIEHVMELVLAATKKHGKYAGIYTGSIEMAKKYRDMGFQYIIVGSDIKHFSTECKRVVQELKG